MKTTKAIVYLRVSPRGRKGDKSGAAIAEDSAESQGFICSKHCNEREYDIEEVFTDLEKSGDDENRDGLWAAVRAVKRGYVLVVWKRERLARSIFLDETIGRMITRQGGTIEAVEGQQEDTSEGEMTRKILAVVAEYEKKAMAARTSAQMRAKQRAGQRMSRADRPPYGQKRDPNDDARLIDDVQALEVIQHILRLREEGKTYQQIQDVLTATATPGPTGNGWHRATLLRIVRRHSLQAAGQ